MTVRPSAAARLYEPNEPVPGTVYRVVKLLAQGGMGNVYDVEDVTVGKRYVLKTLTPDLVARSDLARRMDAEARVLARLSHPNIVDVITAGTTADSLCLPFLVMERLYGQSLRTVLDKRGAVEFPYACKVAIDLLDALEHAHDNGVIHRDVKPENVFLHRTPFGVTVTKLLDFGVMRLSDARVRETQGRFVGTLRYAAPEQLTAKDITPAVDIYAAGLVLYEMLCGRGPFDDEETSARIAKAHVSREAPRASTFVRVPPEVDALLARALSKTPADRPPDAFSFAAELRKHASKPRVSEAPASAASTSAHPMPALSTRAPLEPPNRTESPDEDAARGQAEAQATELVTDVVASAGAPVSAGAAPFNRAATVAASEGEDAPPPIVIDRGAPTRSMVAETPLVPSPPPPALPQADLRRTAPLVATPVSQDFLFPKETGVTSSTEPAAVAARQGTPTRSRSLSIGMVVVVIVTGLAATTAFGVEKALRASAPAQTIPAPSASSSPTEPPSPAPAVSSFSRGDAPVPVLPPASPSASSPAKPGKGPGKPQATPGSTAPSRATVSSGTATGHAAKLPGIDF